MAKKVVAKLKDPSGKNIAKIIKSVKSPKTGAYTYKEAIVPLSEVKKLLSK